jgi:hypothetical protein
MGPGTLMPALESRVWIAKLAAVYYPLRFAGLFNLPIPVRFAFGIGVSRINFNMGIIETISLNTPPELKFIRK